MGGRLVTERDIAFDEFGPLNIRPVGGQCWAPASKPQRQPANYHKTHGVRQFHGCYSIGDDTLWGVVRNRKGADNVLAALRSIRSARPDGDRVYVILDNLSVHKNAKAEAAVRARGAWMLFLPQYSPDLNPIEMAFAKLKAHLRKAATRTFDTLITALGDICHLFQPGECWNYFVKAGYGSD